MISELKLAAERHLAGRRTRDQVFGADRDGFGEPGWDMLLALFAYDAPMEMEHLLRAAAEERIIAERYVDWLCSRDLMLRSSEGAQLSDRGRALMIAYLERAGH